MREMSVTGVPPPGLIRAAAEGDSIAALALADFFEAAQDDARAESWRFLADPPAKGWERRAWEVLRAERRRGAALTSLEPPRPGWRLSSCWGVPGYSPEAGGIVIRLTGQDQLTLERWEWRFRAEGDTGWRDVHDRPGAPPEVRDAVLAACAAALSP